MKLTNGWTRREGMWEEDSGNLIYLYFVEPGVREGLIPWDGSYYKFLIGEDKRS